MEETAKGKRGAKPGGKKMEDGRGKMEETAKGKRGASPGGKKMEEGRGKMEEKAKRRKTGGCFIKMTGFIHD